MIQHFIRFVYTFFEKCVKIICDKDSKGGIKMIEKTTTIGSLLETNPEKAEILINAGMHCLGCPASQAETLEEACDVHGIDVEELLEKLNA